VDVQKERIGDLAAMLGSPVQVTGSLTLQAHVGGTLGNLNGGGHLAVTGGQIYGQAYRSLNCERRFSGQELDATNLKFLEDGGQITGDGGYDIHAKTFHFEAKGSGFELAHFPQIQTAKLALAGQLGFEANGGGPVNAPTAHATLSLSKLVVNSQFEGGLGAKIDLDRKLLNYRINSNLDFAKLELSGETTLTGDYPTQAQVSAENLHIGRLLRLYNVKDISSESVLTLQASVHGPARKPKLMEGTLNVNQFAISVEGIALHSEAALTAQLRGGVLHLDPLLCWRSHGRCRSTPTDRSMSGWRRASIRISTRPGTWISRWLRRVRSISQTLPARCGSRTLPSLWATCLTVSAR
jgi:translocation and assembly module TamB